MYVAAKEVFRKQNAARTMFTWLGAVLVVGCGGGDRTSVTGKVVRHDGAPLAGAMVVARSGATGKGARSQADTEGNFSLGGENPGDGIPPGDYDVIILEDRGDPEHPRPRSIPLKYEAPGKSGIKLTVKPGENAVLDIKLDAA